MPLVAPWLFLGLAGLAVAGVWVWHRVSSGRRRRLLDAVARDHEYRLVQKLPAWLEPAAIRALPHVGAAAVEASDVYEGGMASGPVRHVATISYVLGGAARRRAFRRVVAVELREGGDVVAVAHPDREDVAGAYAGLMRREVLQSD